MITKLVIFILTFSHMAYAGNHMVVIGGGGEAQGNDTTLFDGAFDNLANYYQSAKWTSTTVSFNGGHKKLEETITNKFKKPLNPFTNDNYNSLVDNYINQIKSGSIKSGDQLMIYLDTHGAVRGKDEITHSVATSGEQISNYETLGSSTVSLDKLQNLSKIAAQKGIKLAILDFSCHSGNSLPLANANTCVISSTGPNHYGYGGYGTFSNEFTRLMSKGKNLEDLFLEARKSTTDKSFPMISTPQNGAITEFEYSSISPYLFYYDSTNDKLSPYLMDVASKNLMCQREDGFNKLMAMINQVEKLNTVKKKVLFKMTDVKEIDLTNLKNDLKEYKKVQDNMINQFKKFNIQKLDGEIEIASSDNRYDMRIVDKQKWKDVLSTDYDAQIQRVQERRRLKNDNDPTSTDALLIKYYQNAIVKKQKFLNDNPELASVPRIIKDYDANVQRTDQLAAKIATGEKVLYDALYKGQSGIYGNRTNPCKDFVL